MTLTGRVENMRSSGMLGQLIRFGIAGGVSTLIYSAVYLPLTLYVFERHHAVYAVPFAFAVAVTAGFSCTAAGASKGMANARAAARNRPSS